VLRCPLSLAPITLDRPLSPPLPLHKCSSLTRPVLLECRAYALSVSSERSLLHAKPSCQCHQFPPGSAHPSKAEPLDCDLDSSFPFFEEVLRLEIPPSSLSSPSSFAFSFPSETTQARLLAIGCPRHSSGLAMLSFSPR
jgi:hypothetical protein